MADELAIQPGVNQTQSNSGAYALTGGVIGGAVGGVGAHYLTKPKYASYDDIIKEAQDSTDFSSQIDKAEGTEKDFLTAAKEVADEKTNAGKVWDDEFKAYQEAHKDGKVIEDDAYKALVEKETAAEKALNDKRTALLAEEVETTTGTKPALSESHKKYYEIQKARSERALKEVNEGLAELRKALEDGAKPLKEAIEKHADAIYAARNNVDSLEESYNKLQTVYAKETNPARKAAIKAEVDACKADLKTARKALNDAMKVVEETVAKAADGLEYHGLKGDKLKKAKEAKAKEFKTFVESTVNERIMNNRVNSDVVAGLEEKRTKAFDAIKDIAKRDLSGKEAEQVAERVKLHVDKVETPNLERLKKLQQAYKDAVEATKAAGGTTTTVTTEFTGRIGKGWLSAPISGTTTTTTTTSALGKDAIALAKEGLSDKEKEILDKIVAGKSEAEVNKAFEDAIATRNQNITRLNAAAADVKSVAAQITEKGGEGAYIRDGVLYKLDGSKVEFKPKTFKLASGIELPVPTEMRKLQEQAARLEGQIADYNEKLSPTTTAKAKKYTAEQVEEQVKAEKEAYEAAKKAREGAPRTAVRTEAEQLADFIKEKHPDVTDRDGFINKQVKEKTDKFAKDFENQFKRKYGFAEHASWKIAGVTAAGIALGSLIASAFAPKNNG